MATSFEELRVLKVAEGVADDIWGEVVRWEEFARQVVGGQLARAADSVGANIAEAYGRFHYGEKLQHLYYARGSLFEIKYWLNRAQARGLISSAQTQKYASRLTDVARQVNAFAGNLKDQRQTNQSQPRRLRESSEEYRAGLSSDARAIIFSEVELDWLLTSPATPISNL